MAKSNVTSVWEACLSTTLGPHEYFDHTGCKSSCVCWRYLLHDRDTKFCNSFRSMVRQSGVKPIMLPASSPNLNAFASRVIGGMVRFEYDLPSAWRLHYSWSWFAKLRQTYGYIRPHVVELNR